VVDRASRGEATAVVPSAHLEAADRNRGLGGGLQQDGDVDDPVLRATDDRVAAEEQHRHRPVAASTVGTVCTAASSTWMPSAACACSKVR
jgi:hypothetical protein